MLRNHLMSSVCFATDDALGFSMDDDTPTSNRPSFFPEAMWNALKDDQQTKVLADPRKAYDKLIKSGKIKNDVPFDAPADATTSNGTQGEPDAVVTDDNTAVTEEGAANYKLACALADSVGAEMNAHIQESAARGIDEMIDPVRLSFDIRKAWGNNVAKLPVVGSKKSNLPAGSNELADLFPIKLRVDGQWKEQTVSTYSVMFDRSPYGRDLVKEITTYEDAKAGRDVPKEFKRPAEQLESHLNRLRGLRTRSINKYKYAAKFVIQQNRVNGMPKVNWEFICEIDPETDKVKTFDNGMPMVIGNREMIALWSANNPNVRERCSVKKFMGFDVAAALKEKGGGTLSELKGTYSTGKAARGTKKGTGLAKEPVKIHIETVTEFHDYVAGVLNFLSDPKRLDALYAALATQPEKTEELVYLLGDLSPFIDNIDTKIDARYKVLNQKRLDKAMKEQAEKDKASATPAAA